ncbi:MAG: protein phosphatase CheZ [Gammaproteobacteria bacterium]
MSAHALQADHLLLARRLVDAIEAGDQSGTDELLKALNDGQFEALFHEIGKLTRELHDTLGKLAADDRLLALAQEQMPDARERLNYVITKTEEAADRTLTAVERMQPINDRLGDGIAALRAEVDGATDLERLRCDVRTFLDDCEAGCVTVRGGLTDVMMAQEYQDLTGQVIKRTIAMVNQVEEKLVGLVSACGAITRGTAAKAPASVDPSLSHGPAVRADAAVVTHQDDVDELLADLGF